MPNTLDISLSNQYFHIKAGAAITAAADLAIIHDEMEAFIRFAPTDAIDVTLLKLSAEHDRHLKALIVPACPESMDLIDACGCNLNIAEAIARFHHAIKNADEDHLSEATRLISTRDDWIHIDGGQFKLIRPGKSEITTRTLALILKPSPQGLILQGISHQPDAIKIPQGAILFRLPLSTAACSIANRIIADRYDNALDLRAALAAIHKTAASSTIQRCA